MDRFFKPSVGLAKRMGKYHSRFSSVRLDLTPTHAPIWGMPISTSYVQESVKLRIWRYLGTLGTRVEYGNIAVGTSMVVKGKFSFEFAEGLYERFNFNHDPTSDTLLNDLAKEFVEWLKGLGGRYDGHPKVSEIVLNNCDSIELKF